MPMRGILLQDLVKKAKNHVRVLSAEQVAGEETLKALQVTTKSVLGTVAYNTGGIPVDHGWLRLQGAGSGEMQRTIPTWNEGR